MSTVSRPPDGLSSATALKIRVPRQPRGTIARPELEAKLHSPVVNPPDGPSPVVLVTGAAGAGKTTLVSGWAARRPPGEGIAWVTLDAADDVTTLWNALLAAVGRAGVHPRPGSIAQLNGPRPGEVGSFVAEIAESLAECSCPLWLVLDEIEHLTDPDAVRSLELFLRWVREPVRIVLVGRSDPPIALHRQRLDGRLVEVRGRDLALSEVHAVELLADYGIRLDEGDLRLLLGRTEGWAAGVRLAALALESSEDPHRHLVDFAGDDRAVADFLVGEVLASQAEDVREFLLQTSICDAVCPSLATQLTGRDDAGAVLDELARRNALTVELGGHNGWFRYHLLFGSYLRAELERRSPKEKRELHRAAAAWFEEHGDPARALEHSEAAGDITRLVILTRRHGLGALLAGRAADLGRITTAVPPDGHVEPAVALLGCAVALDRGQTDEADRRLAQVPAGGLDPADDALRAAVVLWRARLAGDHDKELAALEDTVAGRSGDRDLDMLALAERGMSRSWSGRLDEAESDLNEALARARADGRDHLALPCLAHLAALASARGDLIEAARRAEDTISSATSRGWSRSAGCSWAYLARGLSAYQSLDDDQARPDAVMALELTEHGADPTTRWAAASLELATRLLVTDDRHAVAAEAGKLWAEGGAAHVAPAFVAYAAPAHFRMCMQVGERDHARRIVDITRQRLGDVGEVRLLEASLAVTRGRGQERRPRLREVLDGRIRCVTPTALVSAWLLEAVLADVVGDRAAAQRCVAEALTIAMPIRGLRSFAEGGQPVRDLLATGAGRFGRAEAFAAQIRDALHPGPSPAATLLTVREREVLAELPSMRTAGEIAEGMFVSTNTVKTHMRSIYHKLGVPHRRGAVGEARRQGLI
ncbi:LuxR C-terminal-related transcriptional regulator [Actinomycetospora corticicola]|uniref:LuxR family maltose regulon positive regulatory protein n=1 Tax=Actinomycetospora corticicola TaxID=663602 RepID=A0A7Y9DVF5_9PSEU|nr:LuxR C-terminal-related transcriptional regulator [Actinomycetospora corticicola]NYD36154.1 LuxR family maltose regulon positive regulatory protein [Actinomycetospora corticicola]